MTKQFCPSKQTSYKTSDTNKKMRKKKHAVLVEYAILVCSLVPLLFASAALVYSTTGGFGKIGQSIVQFYQRIVTVISLPFP